MVMMMMMMMMMVVFGVQISYTASVCHTDVTDKRGAKSGGKAVPDSAGMGGGVRQRENQKNQYLGRVRGAGVTTTTRRFPLMVVS